MSKSSPLLMEANQKGMTSNQGLALTGPVNARAMAPWSDASFKNLAGLCFVNGVPPQMGLAAGQPQGIVPTICTASLPRQFRAFNSFLAQMGAGCRTTARDRPYYTRLRFPGSFVQMIIPISDCGGSVYLGSSMSRVSVCCSLRICPSGGETAWWQSCRSRWA
jgi:hypothetical protein